jgi:hypothetical protein
MLSPSLVASMSRKWRWSGGEGNGLQLRDRGYIILQGRVLYSRFFVGVNGSDRPFKVVYHTYEK